MTETELMRILSIALRDRVLLEDKKGAIHQAIKEFKAEEVNINQRKYRLLKGLSSIGMGLIVPIFFGLFTIPALLAAAVADEQSQAANQLALFSLCYNNLV
ncbi:hypothetical protein BGZ60DRAFT_427306 [Tricladium varicosporioides]|nr:hypothetical protein BGZ60DRAFT_427306 [Hymenoscyphus varicosporioides]